MALHYTVLHHLFAAQQDGFKITINPADKKERSETIKYLFQHELAEHLGGHWELFFPALRTTDYTRPGANSMRGEGTYYTTKSKEWVTQLF